MATEQTKHERVTEATASAERLMRPQHVPVNVYETGDALVVVAPLPAVRPSDVTIDLTPGHLRITAHLRSAAPKDYLVHEWDYGGYERELDLPPGFGGGVEAALANGQLAVRVLRGQADGRTSVSPQG
ncbi:MAG TPA: Hsp20/alpha crystallin family protein [Acidimicrobiales bacterium]|jgi:HSP20 family molecular chaperone IbpA